MTKEAFKLVAAGSGLSLVSRDGSQIASVVEGDHNISNNDDRYVLNT